MWMMPVAVKHQWINRFAPCADPRRGGATRARELIRRPRTPRCDARCGVGGGVTLVALRPRRQKRICALLSPPRFARRSGRWGERSRSARSTSRAELPSPKDHRRRAWRACHPWMREWTERLLLKRARDGKVAGLRPFLSTGSSCSPRPTLRSFRCGSHAAAATTTRT